MADQHAKVFYPMCLVELDDSRELQHEASHRGRLNKAALFREKFFGATQKFYRLLLRNVRTAIENIQTGLTSATIMRCQSLSTHPDISPALH